LTFATNRQRSMPPLDEAPTARRATLWPRVRAERERAEREENELNAPRLAITPLPTARAKRAPESPMPWSGSMPTPITRLEPAHESAPIVFDRRGDQLAGRYRLLQPLGHGHSADVYLAQASVAGAPGTVALKLMRGADSPARRAFLDSARRQMRVAHVNVVQVVDVGDGEVAYVAMEYVEGCTLEVLLRDLYARAEPLPLPQAVALMAAMCRALDAARPMVHGAVKPSNVLVGRHNVVKLGDFGAPPSPADRMAPEQYAGKRADRRSDVYAAGVVLHELVTGRRVAVAAADEGRWPPLPAPSAMRSGLPPALDDVVAKATRFGPRGRYATAGDLLAAVTRATREAIAGAETGWLGDWVDRARRSS
jgi:serine/threonine protein kinase